MSSVVPLLASLTLLMRTCTGAATCPRSPSRPHDGAAQHVLHAVLAIQVNRAEPVPALCVGIAEIDATIVRNDVAAAATAIAEADRVASFGAGGVDDKAVSCVCPTFNGQHEVFIAGRTAVGEKVGLCFHGIRLATD